MGAHAYHCIIFCLSIYILLLFAANWCRDLPEQTIVVIPGQTITVTSPLFPEVFPYPESGLTCRFSFTSLPGYNVYINFLHFDMGDGYLTASSNGYPVWLTGSENVNDLVAIIFYHISIVWANTTVGYWMEVTAVSVATGKWDLLTHENYRLIGQNV